MRLIETKVEPKGYLTKFLYRRKIKDGNSLL